MRQAFASILLISLFYANFGDYFSFVQEQARIRSFVSQKIRNHAFAPDEFHTIILPAIAENIRQTESGEFLFHGSCYDVIEAHTAQGMLFIRVYCDTDETELRDAFTETEEKENERTVRVKCIALECIPDAQPYCILYDAGKNCDQVQHSDPVFRVHTTMLLHPPKV